MTRNPWDEKYDCTEYVYGTEPNDFLREHYRLLPPGGEILCLADGEGRNSVFLAEQGYQPTALDYSSVALDKARRLAAARAVDVEVLHADLAGYRFAPEAWDGIVSIFCHVAPEIRRRIYQAVPMALTPGGVLILEAYTPRQIEYGTGGPPDPALTVELDELLELLDDEMEILHAVETEREVVEGQLHTGLASVVQLIARRER